MRAKKSFGQHFLINNHCIQTICESFEANDVVLEVGPGLGALTQEIIKKANNFYGIEKDFRFMSNLQDLISTEQQKNPEKSNLKIINDDALTFQYKPFFQSHSINVDKLAVVSNLPYNISAPLTIKFLNDIYPLKMCLMYQREVAAKILMGNKKSNSLGILIDCFYSVRQIFKLGPKDFNPPPKVDSLVLKFDKRNKSKIFHKDITTFEKFLRLIFSQKRKILKNLLKSSYTLDQISRSYEELTLGPNARAEDLSTEQIILLHTKLTH